MKYLIKQMNYIEAEMISKWRYTEPYSIYNMDDSRESIEELLNGSYYSALDSQDNLIGYYCFGESAQVPVGKQFGAYKSEEYIDIGLGIRPDLCGKGIGIEFLRKGIEFGQNQLYIKNFRLTVADFNQRAIKVYERVGFKKVTSFERISENEKIKFGVMIYMNTDI